MRWLWVALMLVLAGLVTPGTAASDEPARSSAPVDLFFHGPGIGDFYINTQTPDPDSEYVPQGGLAMHSGCVEQPATTMGSQSYHTWYGRGTPDHFGEGQARESMHPMSGLMRDLQLDATQPIRFHWYMEAASPTTDMVGDAYVGIAPQVTLDVEVHAGDDISVGNRALHEAPLVAAASVGPVTLTPYVDAPQVTYHDVDGREVYGFHLDLDALRSTIAEDEGYSVIVQASVEEPVCEDGYTMPDLVRPYGGHGLWSRMQVHAHDVVRIDSLHLGIVPEGLMFDAGASSPFGSWDLRHVGLEIDGPVPTPHILNMTTEPSDCCHGGPALQLRDGRWLWNYTADEARPGVYDVTFTVSNLQGTAVATERATFELGDRMVRICEGDRPQSCQTYHRGEEAPGPALLLPLLIALLLGRRWT